MAKVTFNSGLAGFSGKVGNYIFRQQHGRTVVLGASVEQAEHLMLRLLTEAPEKGAIRARKMKDHRA